MVCLHFLIETIIKIISFVVNNPIVSQVNPHVRGAFFYKSEQHH